MCYLFVCVCVFVCVVMSLSGVCVLWCVFGVWCCACFVFMLCGCCGPCWFVAVYVVLVLCVFCARARVRL